jgi:NADPH:quinone reductase
MKSRTTIPTQMKAARVHREGAAEFRIEEVETPTPGPGQVLIRVECAGVNFSDVKRRRGDAYPFTTDFPFVPGGEIAGTVVAHGPGVEGPAIGTPVLALAGANGTGGYAQFAVSYAATAVPIPPGLDLKVAAVLLVAGTTANLLLTRTTCLAAGESILVPAATGGVGSYAVQIARKLGAGKVIAAVGSEAKRAIAIAKGAHHAVNYTASDWPEQVLALTQGKGVDVALEASGGPMLEQTLRCLASFGRLAVFGAASGHSAQLSKDAIDRLFYAPVPNQTVSGFNVGGWFMERPEVAGAALAELMRDILAGRILPPAIRTLSLDAARSAHEMLEGRQTEGKLVITPWS